MRPRKAAGRRRAPPSPTRDQFGFEPVPASTPRASSRASAAVLDRPVPFPAEVDDDESMGAYFGATSNPRSFPYRVKQQCWEKAEKVKGREPERWRRDPLGNLVFRKLVGCPGCLCHDYDHILPYSKGGRSTLENCQVLQVTANRSKGNQSEVSKSHLMQKSAYCRVSGRDMDMVELTSYGNVRRAQESGGCSIQ